MDVTKPSVVQVLSQFVLKIQRKLVKQNGTRIHSLNKKAK